MFQSLKIPHQTLLLASFLAKIMIYFCGVATDSSLTSEKIFIEFRKLFHVQSNQNYTKTKYLNCFSSKMKDEIHI